LLSPSLIRVFAQHGGGRLGHRHDCDGRIGEPELPGPCACREVVDGHLRSVCEAGAMYSIQVADQTFVAADGAQVGAAVADRSNWRRWWPDLRLQVVEDRSEKGMRWAITGALTGTMEIWLEPSLDGVVLHYFLHAEPTGVAAWQLAKLNLAKMTHRRRVAGKKLAFEVKTTLERSRPVGVSPVV
jgi:hypothetical protein